MERKTTRSVFGVVTPHRRAVLFQEIDMTKVTYHIVEHDGGWAYTWQGVFSEPFATRDDAMRAAKAAAAEQQVGGEDAEILFQDKNGTWHEEHADGGDRPEVGVDV